jgi:hypothetical protein
MLKKRNDNMPEELRKSLSRREEEMTHIPMVVTYQISAAIAAYPHLKKAAVLVADSKNHQLRASVFADAAMCAYNGRLYKEALWCIETWQSVPYDSSVGQDDVSPIYEVQTLVFNRIKEMETNFIPHPDKDELIKKIKGL